MKKASLLLLTVSVSILSCKNAEKQDENKSEMATDTTEMANNEVKEDWIVLFDGESLDNWKAYNSEEISNWKIVDDAIVLNPSEDGSENLMTKEEFTNFVLSLDWKISEGGNSGIMWGVKEMEELNEPYYTGPEIQILDNERHPDAKNGPDRQAGALYDMSEPTQDVTKPAGEWNTIVIKIDHNTNTGTVTMNGTKINEFPVNGEEWDKLVENSKFKDWEHFGEYQTGHIALQDHGNKISYRNIKIKKLD